jgi:deoxyribodipyrimidine photo-lyase
MHEAVRLPTPPAPQDGVDAALAWVGANLADLVTASGAPLRASGRFRGGQRAADAALDAAELGGYAARRNEVWPPSRRGASALSPYVRHGLITLPHLWRVAGDAPAADRDKYRDELLWQEYARHVYARLGGRMAHGLRHELPMTSAGAEWRDAQGAASDPWRVGAQDGMACLELVVDELDADGWLPNQVRMWVASHWAVRAGADWRDGEDALYRELVDGSRAANRLGWQWTVGTGTERPYGFSRSQVERRAPGLCASCPLAADCPIADWPEDPPLRDVAAEPLLRDDPDASRTAGPAAIERWRDEDPAAVWLTAESLGDADPALAARPTLPAVFVFDAPLLLRLRLHPRRLIFLAETLGDLATRREMQVWRGDVADVLGERVTLPLTATYAPVPGWRRRAARVPLAEVHPWPWLRRPAGGRIGSFSAWRGGKPRR